MTSPITAEQAREAYRVVGAFALGKAETPTMLEQFIAATDVVLGYIAQTEQRIAELEREAQRISYAAGQISLDADVGTLRRALAAVVADRDAMRAAAPDIATLEAYARKHAAALTCDHVAEYCANGRAAPAVPDLRPCESCREWRELTKLLGDTP